jgi:integrase
MRVKHPPLIKRLKTPPQKYDFLTLEESRKLLSAADGSWRDMIAVALESGLRFGELIALCWEDIDFRTGGITIRQAYAKGVLGSPKSNRIRLVPMSDMVRETLFRVRKYEGLVFSEEQGNPLKQNICINKLRSICKKAGLRKIGWHTLRHTFASHLAQAGANLSAVQELLGHSDIRTTMRYAHINKGVLREAISILNRLPAENFCHNSVTTPAFSVEIDQIGERKRSENGSNDTEKESRSSLLKM